MVFGRTWKYIAPANNISYNIQDQSLTTKSENVETRKQCFHLFIDGEIIDTIIMYTNMYIKKAKQFYKHESRKSVDRIEINVFIGLLLIIGRFKESFMAKK